MAETDATYWIVIDGRNFKTRTPIASQRFGPYASEEEAERALPDLFPEDGSEHVYRVYIEAEPGTEFAVTARQVDK